MWPRKLIWRLYFTYLLVMAIPVVVITWYATDSFTRFDRTQVAEDLKARAFLIAAQVEDFYNGSHGGSVDSLCKALAKKAPTRFTVIAPNGTVIGDSEKDPDSMENHADRPEVREALAGTIGMSERLSPTLRERMVYVAIPARKGSSIEAVVRTSFSVALINNALGKLHKRIALAMIFMAIFAAVVCYAVSRNISLPIAAMKSGARRFAGGDFGFRLPVMGFEETRELAGALNEMARLLNEKLSTITSQKNELDAVLSSMVEGVVAIDAEERIITINSAASELFSMDREHCKGKLIGEALRNIEVQDFLAATLKAEGPDECDLVFPVRGNGHGQKGTELFLQLNGSALRDGKGATIGALMVVNDITKLKKLENVRKDFVANVSHELRTPLTSVKGYVETLQNGALDNRAEADRFLSIISGQVDRINSIVEDLLSLSRIERDAEKKAIDLVPGALCDVLNAAVDTCRHKASLKGITLEIACDKSVVAAMEKSLLEQAVVNLIDNAINYSEEKKRVVIRGEVSGDSGEAVVSVKDEGIGIPGEHLERIFERFYRVDKARSRKQGGTGLGLSIVKHIVLAHRGRVRVESTPGMGSTFYIDLPGKTDGA